jgi:uncharacterized protein DUF4062
VPKSLTQYRIFIGSPGGLEEERKRFRDLLDKYTRLHGEPKGVTFFPVGWEDTVGGAGRPQAIINEDLKQCDYAVFILQDRWGTPTGTHSSGLEEEWELAEQLYKKTSIRNIALFFKKVDAGKLLDPGLQLTKVMDFKKKIEAGKRFLFKQYVETEEYCEALEGHLAQWLREHESRTSGEKSLAGVGPTGSNVEVAEGPIHVTPGFDYWIAEVNGTMNEGR